MSIETLTPPQHKLAPSTVEPDTLLELYRLMVLSRRIDAEATALQRQGELAVWAPLLGQEAAQVGSALALQKHDFAFPSYRELGAALTRGIDPVDYLHFYRGTWHGGMWDPNTYGFAPVSVPVASQALHAVGWAMGARLEGSDACALAYFGDGATSEGDFHEACNFAGVYDAPVVFFCQNNQWAISVPLAKQTAGAIWRKAQAYGFDGIRVDGNDVLAVYAATRKALERARSDGTPTLIEALTYRMGPHSTADDDSVYRDPADVELWRSRDPIMRFAKALTDEGVLDDETEARFAADADAAAARVREHMVDASPPDVDDLFRFVFSETPQHLARQRDEVVGLRG